MSRQGPYRSGPVGGATLEGLDELEAKLRASVRRRRLVMGFLSLVTGLGLIAMGIFLAAQGFDHGRGGPRIAVASMVVGLLLTGVAFVILRVGELRQVNGLEVVESEPIPWSTLGAVSAGILAVALLVAAYPLGIYRWAGTVNSGCRKVFTPADASALGLPPFAIDRVVSQSHACSMTGRGDGDARTVHVTLESHGDIDYLGGYHREPLPHLGDEAYLIERAGERIIAVRRARAVMRVHVAASRYDHAAALKIVKHLESRVSQLDGYL